MYSNLWLSEKIQDIYSTGFKVKKVLFSGKSEFQTVDVVETEGFGKMLLNDGLVMLCERDEFIYHEMIVHVPMFTHGAPKNVLIIGGGDGGTAREVLRHECVEKCTMVEIDSMVVDACKEFIPSTSLELDNPKLNLKIEDGLEFVKKTDEKFDVIIIDSTDPIGPAKPLFGNDFYQDVSNCLFENGIVVSQGESPFFNEAMQKTLLEVLGNNFPIVQAYNFTNLTYPGGLWTFTFASKETHPVKNLNTKKIDEFKHSFKYYNEQIHRSSFMLPQFMLEKYNDLLKG